MCSGRTLLHKVGFGTLRTAVSTFEKDPIAVDKFLRKLEKIEQSIFFYVPCRQYHSYSSKGYHLTFIIRVATSLLHLSNVDSTSGVQTSRAGVVCPNHYGECSLRRNCARGPPVGLPLGSLKLIFQYVPYLNEELFTGLDCAKF